MAVKCGPQTKCGHSATTSDAGFRMDENRLLGLDARE